MSVFKNKKIFSYGLIFLFLFFLIAPAVSLAAEYWFVIQTDAPFSDGYTTESECNSKRISKARNLVANGEGDSMLTECFKYSKSRAFILDDDYPDFLGDHPTKKASEILAESGETNWWFTYKYTKDTEYRKKGDYVVAGPYKDQPACEDVWQKQDKTNIVLTEACRESAIKPITPENDANNSATPANSKTTYTPLAPLPWLETTNCIDENQNPCIDTKKSESNPCPFGNYLNILIKIFLGVCAVLAMVMIVIGGIEYMTSDLASSKEAGKKTITMAILGLLLALGAYLILKTINPKLLDVCLNNLPTASITISPEQQEIIKRREGGGNCQVVTDPTSPCYPDKLKTNFIGNKNASAPFNTLAAQASAICQLESNAIPNMPIGRKPSQILDKCSDNKPFSFGLFQINASAHRNSIPACNGAFEIPAGHGTSQGNPIETVTTKSGQKYNSKWSCKTIEPAYTQCQNYLINPINNIKYAATSSNLNRWTSWTTYNSCKGNF